MANAIIHMIRAFKIIFFWIFFLSLSQVVALPSECHFSVAQCKKLQQITQLIKKPGGVAEHYDATWKSLHMLSEKAYKCKRNEDAAHFLFLAAAEYGNAEVNEFLSEKVEELLLNKTVCFIDGVFLLPIDKQKALRQRLKYPLTTTTEEMTDALHAKAGNGKESIMNLLF